MNSEERSISANVGGGTRDRAPIPTRPFQPQSRPAARTTSSSTSKFQLPQTPRTFAPIELQLPCVTRTPWPSGQRPRVYVLTNPPPQEAPRRVQPRHGPKTPPCAAWSQVPPDRRARSHPPRRLIAQGKTGRAGTRTPTTYLQYGNLNSSDAFPAISRNQESAGGSDDNSTAGYTQARHVSCCTRPSLTR
ncbi:hypothetical protein GY45DRAFT_874422 [Cubamyces sp. BRFM 1775]|nr:hypothetical protein GY45DRAFT_874422 [Cubamyces sp. BRFM 1775]